MPDLSQLLNAPTAATGARGSNILRGIIRKAPVSANDSLEVVATSYTAQVSYQVPAGHWTPRGALPQLNASCLLVIDETGDAYMLAYTGTGASGGGMTVYEQPDEPAGTPPVGSIWIDTDAPVPGTDLGTKLATQGKGYIAHGTNATYPRGTGFVSYEWVGSVEPLNAFDGDTWIDVVI